MPELPEVEVTRRALEPMVDGQVLIGATVRQPRLRYPVPDLTFDHEPVLRLVRRAKYLILETAGGALVFHLGMSGTLRYLSADQEAQRHDHVDLRLASGALLRYRDPRRFGALLRLIRPEGEIPGTAWWEHGAPFRHLGPEPFDPALTAARWYRETRGKSRTVKSWLMDGLAVVGAGNIYAAESLFLAGIDPRRAIGDVGLGRYQRLLSALRQVLTQAIEAGGSTLRDFVDGHGVAGYFQQQHQVYGRGGEPCPKCRTPLRQIRQGQRTTVYCPRCQR